MRGTKPGTPEVYRYIGGEDVFMTKHTQNMAGVTGWPASYGHPWSSLGEL